MDEFGGGGQSGRLAIDNACDSFAENPCAVGGTAAGIVAAVLLVVFSLGAVPPLHYGIRYNHLNKQADVANVYEPGRYVIWPMNAFLLFPMNIQSVEFSRGMGLQSFGILYPALHTRTKDGLALHLQASLQYKLREKDVGLLYKEFSMDYENFIVSQVRNVLITVSADFTGTEFWTKRKELGEVMENMVNETLSETYAECWGLQILDIELPNDFNQAIVTTQVKAQKIATQRFEQKSAQVRAHTEVIQAEFHRRVKVIKVGGKANYTYLTKAASAFATNQTISTEAAVTEDIKQRLKLGAKDLLEYQEYLALLGLENSSFLYGFDEGAGVLMDKPGPAAPAGDASPAPAPPALEPIPGARTLSARSGGEL